MKKIILSFIALLVFIPICINATVYANFKVSQENTTKYIKNFKSYQWFIDPTTKYLYEGNTLKTLSGFSKGGFVNQFEYNASLLSGKSYLSNVMKYWTMTSNGSSSYSVVGNNITTFSEVTEELGSRITEYIRKKTKVTGSGTYTDPWEFVDPDFETKLTFSNPQITGSSGVTGEKTAGYGDTITYVVELTNNGLEAAKITLNEIKLQESIGTKVKKTSEAELSTTLNGIVSGETKPNAVIAMNALLSENGYTFVLEPGQTITLKYNVVVIGNAGDKIVNQVVYTVDGLQPKANDPVTVNIERFIKYNEIKDNGANVILALDNSGSMRNPRLAALKKAYPVFTESLLGENANDNNVVCSVIMPCSYRDTIEYLCTKSKDEMNNFLSKKLTAINGCLTPYSVTLDKSRELIEEKAKLNPNFGNYIVLLSDGMPEGDVSSNAYKKSAEKITNHTLGIKFYTIGFNTTTTAANLLKSISSTPSSEYFKEAQNTDLSKIFEDIASSIELVDGQTIRGVREISIDIDKTKNLIFEITNKNNVTTKIIKTYVQALNEGYLIDKATKYEIDFRKFDPTDKVSVTYFLKKSSS